ncbi:MAG: phosphoglycerate transporter protein PgtP [Bdellovibrionota bacterium]
MLNFLKPAPAIAPLPVDKQAAEYKRLKWQVFAGIFIGYAAFYLVRKNLSLALPDILAEYPQYSKAQIGGALTALSLSYGISKFLMGSVSDRSNPKYFLPLGLLLSCLCTFAMGIKSIYTSLSIVFVLQALNGWVQGMGWPPCGKTVVHWFPLKERGQIMSVWNVAHNVGGAMVATFALWGLNLFGDWTGKFTLNALVAAALAILVFFLMKDRPESCGLPPVKSTLLEVAPESTSNKEVFTFKEIFFEHVLNNRYLWYIALANAFVYFVRYGVVDWIPTYFQTVKGLSFEQSSRAWSLFEWAAIPGTIFCGWMSDKVFKGKRAPATILFMGLTMIGIFVYWFNEKGPIWIDYAALISIGFLIYGPVMLIGLHALDLVPKQAAGTAAGFTGFFGYVFGSSIAGTGVGWIADHYQWRGVFITMIACCLIAMALSFLTLLRDWRLERKAQKAKG